MGYFNSFIEMTPYVRYLYYIWSLNKMFLVLHEDTRTRKSPKGTKEIVRTDYVFTISFSILWLGANQSLCTTLDPSL